MRKEGSVPITATGMLTIGAAGYVAGKSYDIATDIVTGRPKQAADKAIRLAVEGVGVYALRGMHGTARGSRPKTYRSSGYGN